MENATPTARQIGNTYDQHSQSADFFYSENIKIFFFITIKDIISGYPMINLRQLFFMKVFLIITLRYHHHHPHHHHYHHYLHHHYYCYYSGSYHAASLPLAPYMFAYHRSPQPRMHACRPLESGDRQMTTRRPSGSQTIQMQRKLYSISIISQQLHEWEFLVIMFMFDLNISISSVIQKSSQHTIVVVFLFDLFFIIFFIICKI